MPSEEATRDYFLHLPQILTKNFKRTRMRTRFSLLFLHVILACLKSASLTWSPARREEDGSGREAKAALVIRTGGEGEGYRGKEKRRGGRERLPDVTNNMNMSAFILVQEIFSLVRTV